MIMAKKLGMAVIEDIGRDAFRRGERFSKCPYSDKKSATAWRNGWLEMHHKKMQIPLRLGS